MNINYNDIDKRAAQRRENLQKFENKINLAPQILAGFRYVADYVTDLRNLFEQLDEEARGLLPKEVVTAIIGNQNLTDTAHTMLGDQNYPALLALASAAKREEKYAIVYVGVSEDEPHYYSTAANSMVGEDECSFWDTKAEADKEAESLNSRGFGVAVVPYDPAASAIREA